MSWACVYMCMSCLLLLYGLGRSYCGLYYPAQPPLFLANIHFVTRTDIIPETWVIPTFGSTVARCCSTVPLSMQTSQPIRRNGGAY